MEKLPLLIVDDDEFVCEDIATSLKPECFDIEKAFSYASALSQFSSKRHAIVITDLQLENSDNDGLLLLEKIKELSPEAAVMIITNHTDIRKAVKAMQLGALDYVTKPFDADQIAIKVDKLAERVSLLNENINLRREISLKYEIIGDSKPITDLKKQIALVSKKDVTVLITGPSGTGKELIAGTLHCQSPRIGKPFIPVNCAAIPAELIESELFGTVKGAFSGAVDKKGKFELAANGTIFLDEIGDMSLAAQAKVLRALDTKECSRVGSEKTIMVNVRIFAATNKNLEEMVKQGTFRLDLYHRLNVIEIKAVPLSEHTEDIPLLINHILKRMGRTIAINRIFTQEALSYLQSLDWPGNVRQLYNAVEKAMIFWEGKLIGVDGIKEFVTAAGKEVGNFFNIRKSLKDASNDFEKLFITKVIDECNGNRTEAAKKLDISRQNLYEKIHSLGLSG